eukprot:1576878-Amphidinium_carterae.1
MSGLARSMHVDALDTHAVTTTTCSGSCTRFVQQLLWNPTNAELHCKVSSTDSHLDKDLITCTKAMMVTEESAETDEMHSVRFPFNLVQALL